MKFFVNSKKYVESHRYLNKKHAESREIYKYYMKDIRESYATYSNTTKKIKINLALINKDFDSDKLLNKIYEAILHESLHVLINDEVSNCHITQHSYIFRLTDYMYPGFINDETKKWFLFGDN